MNTIGLWLDKTSDPDNPQWVISLEKLDETGESDCDTLDEFGRSHSRAARRQAIAIGKERKLPVVYYPIDGTPQVLHATAKAKPLLAALGLAL